MSYQLFNSQRNIQKKSTSDNLNTLHSALNLTLLLSMYISFERKFNNFHFVDCSDSNLVTFDSIATEPLSEIPADYINLTWKNFHVINISAFPVYDSSGFRTALRSGYVAFNKNGTMMTISSNPPYVFNVHSFIATSGFQNQLKLVMYGYRGTNRWYSAMYPLYTHWPQLIKLDYLNITTITFETNDIAEFAMDNLCISM